ncbi:response regulator transcription factor [Tenacibaculum holothuriorum]|uniref:response regulator transcription factor n=1 Tax=Tenacibaculum holothuriorum TaxID=1635173 RepID=UPI000A32A964|nr:helix-turn-helix transcriptional regulator [Tenacibaculum holothuriorum]
MDYLKLENETNKKNNHIEKENFRKLMSDLVHMELSTKELLLLKNTLNIKCEDNFLTHSYKFNSLTNKELEVFFLICDGLIPKEIAEKLFIEVSTAQTHRRNIIKKLDIKTFKDWCFYASFSEYKKLAS